MQLHQHIRGKIERARELGWRSSVERMQQRLRHACGYRASVRRLAYWMDRYSRALYDGPYEERLETGPLNIAVKLARQAAGGPFEPPAIAIVSHAAAALLRPGHRRILEIGAGTGRFAWIASLDPARSIIASEFDKETRAWAATHRRRPNVDFTARRLEECADGEFDVIVAIEVIEHIHDYGAVLRQCARVADELIISTPNRQRSPFTSVDRTPAYSEHVREWNGGELLWVLRAFYQDVQLFTIPDLAKQAERLRDDTAWHPALASCSDLTCEDSLIAVCSRALR
jgi:2-polyprenyl-3-methyl-5-hydroxy-6-metoxy-1,4-benzoquinol methylase